MMNFFKRMKKDFEFFVWYNRNEKTIDELMQEYFFRENEGLEIKFNKENEIVVKFLEEGKQSDVLDVFDTCTEDELEREKTLDAYCRTRLRKVLDYYFLNR